MKEIAPPLLDGLILAFCLVIATYQLRFWRRSRDRLFLFFAVAFLVLAGNRVALALAEASEARTYVYVVRLVAFCLILYGIWDKNRRSRRGGDAPLKPHESQQGQGDNKEP